MSGKFIEAKDVARQEFPGMGILGMLSKPTENEKLLFGDLTFAPGDGFNFHHHPNQDEALYLIDGSLEAWIDQEKRTLNPGDTMWLPKGTVHASFNTSGKPAKMFVLLTPVITSEELGFELVDVSGETPWKDLR